MKGASTTAGSLVLVIGGTRGTGQLIVRRLCDEGFTVRVLARDPERARQRIGRACEILPGDLTIPATLPPALNGANHLVFTAGCRSGHPATERRIRETEYDGVLHTLSAARATGFQGRFLYMTASSVGSPSAMARLLNLYKGNTLRWRWRAEAAIRASNLDYTVIRAGFLVNRPGGRRAIRVTQEALPLSLRYRIARADVADAFVAALGEPRTSRTTFEIVWGHGSHREPWSRLFATLRPDDAPSRRADSA